MNRLNTLAPDLADDRPTARGADISSHDEPTADADGARHEPVNIGSTERGVSIVAGSVLTAAGVARALFRGRLVTGGLLAWAGVAVARRGLSGHCRLYHGLGIDYARDDRPDPTALYDHGIKVEEAVVVNRPAAELYAHWRDVTNLAAFMPHVDKVEEKGDGRTHWTCKGPGGMHWEYDAETINDEPPHLLAWRTAGPADVQHAGSVRFVELPAAGGTARTAVRVNIEYLPPAGFVGRFGATLLRLVHQDPSRHVRESLENFKKIMEGQPTPTA